MGLMPLTGVPLPFLSYGGRYVVSLMASLAIAQRIAIERLGDFMLSGREKDAFILKGYAGTGKTSLVGALVRLLDSIKQKVILLRMY